jgi:hypothetical protein
MKKSSLPALFIYLFVSGILATLAMDTAALALIANHLGNSVPYRIVPGLLGRWIGSMLEGKFVHSTILETPGLPHEMLLGLIAHYLIGITLTALILYPARKLRHAPPSLRQAMVFALGTCVLPYFVMFPAMGFGVFGLKQPEAIVRIVFSTVNHAAFGLGIFLWSNILGTLLAERLGFQDWKSRQPVLPPLNGDQPEQGVG